MPELLWRVLCVLRLILIGVLIGFLIANYFFIQPILEGWEACTDGWEITLVSLRQCASVCNSSAVIKPEQPFGEVYLSGGKE
jgi:hypothetical protein